MKKPHKNFVVEYKGARRKPTLQSSSIWGNVDLRRFAEHDGNVEVLRIGGLRADSDAAMHEVAHAPASTINLQRETTSIFSLEVQMADDPSMSEQVSTEPETALQKVPEPKKRRPRTKKVASETAASNALVEAPAVKKTRAKRGSKNAATEVTPSARPGGRKAKSAVEAVVGSATQAVSPITAAAEMEDLLQLEQENNRLRKLLAEKLREENTILRKRLGLD
ncbi:transcriptional regulator [Pararhizobium qamdonense]|uniref:transcriptional regulator n=1 Tax=Pararhizobium qamdonense TaxID=3031126 RepID=UPI0023E25621|nr:transcriptional regulator [Pararhizobium qamdonense]